jgi:elongator complex protein 3
MEKNCWMKQKKLESEHFDARKILVTSGLGVKEYYHKLGYSDDGPYMSKTQIRQVI